MYKCQVCKQYFDSSDTYEYRGAYACTEHFDEMVEKRDAQRNEIIREESAKTEIFRGLDLDPTTSIGKANREILSKHIEVASKESGRLKEYERPSEAYWDSHVGISTPDELTADEMYQKAKKDKK